MRGIFAMLFGAGIILFIQIKEEAGAGLELAEIWYRRLILLIIFGVAHSYLLVWPGEILFSYGMIGLLLFPFRNSRPRNLILIATGILMVGMILNFGEANTAKRQQKKYFKALEMFNKGDSVPHSTLMDYYGWIERYAVMKPTEERLENRVRNMQGGYFSAVKEMAKDSYYFESEYHYRHNYIDILSMMLLGMALLKLKVFHAKRSFRFYGLLVLIGYGIGIPLNYWETTIYIESDFDLITYYDLLRSYDLGRVPVMLGHVGLVMLFCKSGFFKLLQHAMSAVGRMALSNYLLQTIIVNVFFIGFSQYGRLQRYELYYIVLAVWVFQIILSSIWLKYFAFGPFEWLWRSLTYRKFQQFKR
ncbi:MAG: DUF418 domain-containing protein [Bacteroidales bacterium]|nr:DUF418 domain-containing protein [Bacteroidales bacterium]